MKWLITGGCGFNGRALASELLATEGQRVRVLDNLSVGTKADLGTLSAFSELPVNKPEQEWGAPLALCEANILHYEAVASALVGADVVIHRAANTGVGLSVEEPFMAPHPASPHGAYKLAGEAYYSDTTKAAALLGWRAEVDLHDGLRRTLRYFLNKKIGKGLNSCAF